MDPAATPRRIVFLVWRDTSHPDGGGSEVYVEHMARWLAEPRPRRDDLLRRARQRPGRRGPRRGPVPPPGRPAVASTRAGWPTCSAGPAGAPTSWSTSHNGIPFASPLVRRRGVHVLVHHVHREQWQIIYPGVRGRIGWWVESWLAPRLYRRQPYLTVSRVQPRATWPRLGVEPDRISVVCNGIDVPHPSRLQPRSATPRICVLGRLVPHKQVEHALRVLAALRRRAARPAAGRDRRRAGGSAELAAAADELGVSDRVTFHGQVTEAERDALLDASWLMLAPSVKEGWGIAIMEAAARSVPAIAYSFAGGVTESIVDGETGLLVADLDGADRADPGAAGRHRGAAGDGQEGPRAGAELRLAASAARVRADLLDWTWPGRSAVAVVDDRALAGLCLGAVVAEDTTPHTAVPASSAPTMAATTSRDQLAHYESSDDRSVTGECSNRRPAASGFQPRDRDGERPAAPATSRSAPMHQPSAGRPCGRRTG